METNDRKGSRIRSHFGGFAEIRGAEREMLRDLSQESII